MPRTVNARSHAVRRDAFLDAAQRLIQTRGYEQTSIQDILDELDASRGAFYHYFDSKGALLEAIVERLVVTGIAAVAPLVEDPGLAAPEKFARLFGGVASFKAERRELIAALLRVWYSDDNALLRDKLRRSMARRLVPLLTAIVEQGRSDGVFTIASAEGAGDVLLALLQGAQDMAGDLFFARESGAVGFDDVMARFAVYQAAFERVLGAPAGSLPLIDPGQLRTWYG